MKKTSCAVVAAIALGLAISILPAAGQTNSTWLGGLGTFAQDKWSDTSLWNPHTVPNGNFNVTINWNPAGEVFNGPELDVNITIQNLTTVNRVFLDNQSICGGVFPCTGSNLTVNGTTSDTTSPGHDGEHAAWFNAGGTWLLGTLSNYNPATHTLDGPFFAVFIGGTIGWKNADIQINKGTLNIGSATSRLIDQDTNSSAVRNLSDNQGGFEIDNGYNFNSAANFSNNGQLGVKTTNGVSTIFTVTGSLTNYDPATHVLTGGYYDIEDIMRDGAPSGTARLRFPNADIRTLDNATIVLAGPGASIVDSTTGLNGLRNLSGIRGSSLTSAGTLTISPSGGTFNVDSSTHNIDNSANVTIQGNHHTTNGSVTHVGNPNSGTQAPANTTLNTSLTINGHSIIDGGGLDFGGQPNVNTQYHTELHVMNGIDFRGAYLTGTGTTFADVGLIQGSVLNPGHSPGELTFVGNLTLDSSTETDIQIAGLSAGDEFDQVAQSNGTLTLGGKLLVSFLDLFENVVGNSDTFSIITSSANLNGSFSNVASGKRMATNDGKGTFIVTYAGSHNVTLSNFLPPPPNLSVKKLPGENFKLLTKAFPEAEVYDFQDSPDLDPNNFSRISTIGSSGGPFEAEGFGSNNYTRRFYRLVFPGTNNPARAQSKKNVARSTSTRG